MTITIGSGSTGTILPFAATTPYITGQPVTYNGVLYTAKTNFTSGSSFSASNWNVVAGASTGVNYTGQNFQGQLLGGASDRSLGSASAGSNGTDTQTQSRTRWTLARAVPNLAFVFGNWQGNANSVTLRAGIEVPGGAAPIPLFFQGKRDVTIEQYGIVTCDPVGVPLPAGANVYVRTRMTCTSGGIFPLYYAADSAMGEGSESGTSVTDKTTSGTFTPGFNNLVGPLMLVALAATGSRPMIGGVGDSIMGGAGDYYGPKNYGGTGQSVTGQWSFGRRLAYRTGNAFYNAGIGGDAFAYWADQSRRSNQSYALRRMFVAGCRYIHCHLGINDVTNGRTLSQMQADGLAVWTDWALAGISVYQDTLTPHTTSTDNWATLVNQTVVANESVRLAFNAWLRDGAPIDATSLAAVAVGTSSNVLRAGATGHPLAAVFEMADAVESSRNSGKWGSYTFTADIANTSQAITNVAPATVTRLQVGDPLVGPGIPSASLLNGFSSSTSLILGAVTTAGTTGATITVPFTADGLHPSPLGHLTLSEVPSAAYFA